MCEPIQPKRNETTCGITVNQPILRTDQAFKIWRILKQKIDYYVYKIVRIDESTISRFRPWQFASDLFCLRVLVPQSFLLAFASVTLPAACPPHVCLFLSLTLYWSLIAQSKQCPSCRFLLISMVTTGQSPMPPHLGPLADNFSSFRFFGAVKNLNCTVPDLPLTGAI